MPCAETADDLVCTLNGHASVAAGYNVCIFAYGQTGSGKTHTMAGSDCAERGINYRALDDLFAINEERQGEVRPPLLIISGVMAGHWRDERSLCIQVFPWYQLSLRCWTSARQWNCHQLAINARLSCLVSDNA